MVVEPDLQRYVERRASVLRGVQELLVARLHLDCAPDEIDADSPLLAGGLDLDSMDVLEIMVALDTTFQVRIADDATARRALRSPNGLVDLILATANESLSPPRDE